MVDDAIVVLEDLETIGEKIVDMADRVKAANAVRPGAQARWVFEMDGTLYRVLVTVETPSREVLA